ncbi:MAG: hypothetical protein LJE96_08205 [Deltaproteobacteria bacterium]|jgi:hypothetical protein|nr:hypothetical protein [Deltaproteobacteria bacterium]
MARLVESVVTQYGDTVRWEKVITKELKGAQRFIALSKELGRPAPVPSIYINGKLTFDITPESEQLREVLNGLVSG